MKIIKIIQLFNSFLSALIWQIMRAYTLSVLTSLANSNTPIIEKEIVAWVSRHFILIRATKTIRKLDLSILNHM